jgi:hypothetical protein
MLQNFFSSFPFQVPMITDYLSFGYSRESLIFVAPAAYRDLCLTPMIISKLYILPTRFRMSRLSFSHFCCRRGTSLGGSVQPITGPRLKHNRIWFIVHLSYISFFFEMYPVKYSNARVSRLLSSTLQLAFTIARHSYLTISHLYTLLTARLRHWHQLDTNLIRWQIIFGRTCSLLPDKRCH